MSSTPKSRLRTPHLSLALSFLLGSCAQLSHAHSAAPYLLPEQFDIKNILPLYEELYEQALNNSK